MKAIWIIFVVIAVWSSEEKDELIFVAHLSNVGARFPNRIPASWVKAPGELTHVGMRQLYLLGRELRKQYIEDKGLLGEQYNPTEYLLRAASYNMTTTIASANAFARGLYLPGSGYSLNSDEIKRAVPPNNSTNYTEFQRELRNAALLNFFDSVPVLSYGGGPDYGLAAAKYCNNLEKLIQSRADQNDTLERRRDELNQRCAQGVYKELSQVFKKSIQDMQTALEYRDYIISAKYYGQDYGQISEAGLRQLDEIYSFVKYEEYFEDPMVARIISNGVIGEIVDLINKTMEGNEKRVKMASYFVENNNILALLRLLQHNASTGYVQIPFASSLQLEMYHTDPTPSPYALRLFFNGKQIKWPDGSYDIGVTRFIYWAKQITVPDFASKCLKQGNGDKAGSDTPWVVAGAIVGAAIVVMLVITCLYILRKEKSESEKNEDAEEASGEIRLTP